MSITERTLRSWRRDALIDLADLRMFTISKQPESVNLDILHQADLNNRILLLSGELLDQKLLNSKKGKVE
jgi:hypothetical protein